MFRHALLSTVSASAFAWAAELVRKEQEELAEIARRRAEVRRRFAVNRCGA